VGRMACAALPPEKMMNKIRVGTGLVLVGIVGFLLTDDVSVPTPHPVSFLAGEPAGPDLRAPLVDVVGRSGTAAADAALVDNLEHHVSEHPADADAWLHLADLYALEGKFFLQIAALLQYAQHGADEEDIALVLDQVTEYMIDYMHEMPLDDLASEAMTTLFDQVLDLRDHDSELHWAAAQAHLIVAQTERARYHLRRAAESEVFSELATARLAELDQASKGYQSVPLVEHQGVRLVTVNIGGVETQLRFDPGVPVSALSAGFVSAHANRFRALSPDSEAASPEVSPNWIRLGGATLRSQVMVVADGGHLLGYNGVIGADVLHKLNFRIDENSGAMLVFPF